MEFVLAQNVTVRFHTRSMSRTVISLCRYAVVRFLLVDARGKIDIRLLRMNLPGLPGLGCGDSFGENSGHA